MYFADEGTKYLAKEAECFGMMDAIASHLSEIGKVTGLSKRA